MFDWLRFILETPSHRAQARERREQHNRIYDADYYKSIDSSATSSCEIMAETIVRDLSPRHAIDVGCGTGALLKALQTRGVQVAGLEYADEALALCEQRGLTVRQFDISHDRMPAKWKQRDVALSFEVAEHLPEPMANRFLDLLTSASDTVVLSAATPGQGGTDHINEQPHDYWIQKMVHRGFVLDEATSRRWRAEWQGKTADWYQRNVMVFRRRPKRSNAA
jgi:cyclopropane fatty-acyl-phospholipid synthase-like methyltransferase